MKEEDETGQIIIVLQPTRIRMILLRPAVAGSSPYGSRLPAPGKSLTPRE